MVQVAPGAPLPEEPRKRWYRVESPKGSERKRVTLLDECWTGFWVHWDGCVVPCSNNHECRLCRQGNGNRWQAYMAAWDLVVHRRFVLALSEGAARTLLNHRRGETGLRGLSIEITRKFPLKANSALLIKVLGYQNPQEVFAPHPIMDSLNRLFGLNEQYIARGGAKLSPPPRQGDDFDESQDVTTERPAPPSDEEAPAPKRLPVTPTQLAERFRLPGDV